MASSGGDLAPRQRRDRRRQLRIGRESRDVDIVHMTKEFVRIDAVFVHQPVQRRAVALVVTLLNLMRLGIVDAEARAHVGPHPLVDLGKEPARRRIERVVEVEDPEVDGAESGAVGHGRREDA